MFYLQLAHELNVLLEIAAKYRIPNARINDVVDSF